MDIEDLVRLLSEATQKYPRAALVVNPVANLSVVNDGDYVAWIDLRSDEPRINWVDE